MRFRDVYRLQREQNSFLLLHSPPYNGNYLLRQSGCPRKPDSLRWRRTWKMMADASRFTGSLYWRHTCVEDNARQQEALTSALTPATCQNIRSAHDSLSSSRVTPADRCLSVSVALSASICPWEHSYIYIFTRVGGLCAGARLSGEAICCRCSAKPNHWTPVTLVPRPAGPLWPVWCHLLTAVHFSHLISMQCESLLNCVVS